jgi:hypothetical protein
LQQNWHNSIIIEYITKIYFIIKIKIKNMDVPIKESEGASEPQGAPVPEPVLPPTETEAEKTLEPVVETPQIVAETPAEQKPEAEFIEEEFDYYAEGKKIQERYDMRMSGWESVMKEGFKTQKNYETWRDFDESKEKIKIEEGSDAERLIPLAKVLKQRIIDIVEEKNAAMLKIDEKKSAILMKKAEAI